MAYDKHTWGCGEKLTPAKLNHIEEGIENSSGGSSEPFIINYLRTSSSISYYDKTWKEAYDVFMSGRPVFVDASNDPLFLSDLSADISFSIYTAVLQVVAMTEQPGTGSVQTTYRALLGSGSKDYLLATDTTPYLYWYHNGTK